MKISIYRTNRFPLITTIVYCLTLMEEWVENRWKEVVSPNINRLFEEAKSDMEKGLALPPLPEQDVEVFFHKFKLKYFFGWFLGSIIFAILYWGIMYVAAYHLEGITSFSEFVGHTQKNYILFFIFGYLFATIHYVIPIVAIHDWWATKICKAKYNKDTKEFEVEDISPIKKAILLMTDGIILRNILPD